MLTQPLAYEVENVTLRGTIQSISTWLSVIRKGRKVSKKAKKANHLLIILKGKIAEKIF